MKLFVTIIMAHSLLASGAAFAQTGRPTASDAPQPGLSQGAQTIKVMRSGPHAPSPGPAEHFTGSASVDRFLVENPPSHTSGASVAFEPGARTAWHNHPLGQTLI